MTGRGARARLARLKLLVVNADDLGYDPEIDRGILEAHARGIVTSATVMVLSPFARAALGAAPPTLGVGLHAVVPADLSRAAAEAELRAQLGRFEDLRGAAPTHLDSHKHAHAAPAILAAFTAVAAERGLPVRAIDAPMRAALRAGGVVTADRFLGDAARRPAWTEEALVTALLGLEEGATELMAHPGYAPSHARTSFGHERELELAALCSPRARAAADAAGAVLCDYAEFLSQRPHTRVAGRLP
ncbi:YdjC family protein [Anaeromyxobacter sp. Fw109-5]|nr:YdjC family protein [Anaeromyxobacter sp. Fw109-5]